MKNALIKMIFALAIGPVAIGAVAQTASQDRPDASQDQVARSSDVIAANESQGAVSKWKEPASTSITVTSTPLEKRSLRNQTSTESSNNRPSKEDFSRCVQNDRCVPRNVFNNKWDRAFGPAYDFGN